MPKLLIVSFLLFTACTEVEVIVPSFCVVSEHDVETSIDQFDRDGGMRNLRLMNEFNPSETFENCARGMDIKKQFELFDGELLWLGIKVPPPVGPLSENLFDGVDVVDLFFHQVQGFAPKGILTVVDSQGPLVLIESGGSFEIEDTRGLRVEKAEPTGIGAYDACGTRTPLGIRFAGDDEALVGPGENAAIAVNGRRGRVHNLGTFEASEGSSEDSRLGLNANWAFFAEEQ